MPNPISALECQPSDFVREVSSIDTINFYADGLSGLYLPGAFIEQARRVDSLDVRYWKPQDRLHGKFGRFALQYAEEDEQAALDDILVMGTTIGLHGLSGPYQDMESLRHSDLHEGVLGIMKARGLLDKPVRVNPVDYGATKITLNENGRPQSIAISGSSIDFGRANAEGREQTCALFRRILGDSISVLNEDPEPKSYERVIA